MLSSNLNLYLTIVLQSETCSVEIPELEFELGMAVLGGKFTTLEGLLKDIRELVSLECGWYTAPLSSWAGERLSWFHQAW